MVMTLTVIDDVINNDEFKEGLETLENDNSRSDSASIDSETDDERIEE